MKKISFNKITKDINDGALDLTLFKNQGPCIKYTVNTLVITSGVALYTWLSCAASKLYLFYGEKGAGLIPGNPSFNQKTAGPSSFASNTSLSFYFLIYTTLAARKGYLYYQLRKKHNIPISKAKLISMLSTTAALAAVAMYPFFELSSITHSEIDEVATALVNFLLSYLGSYAMTTVLFALPVLVVIFCIKCCAKKQSESLNTENTDISGEIPVDRAFAAKLSHNLELFREDPIKFATVDDLFSSENEPLISKTKTPSNLQKAISALLKLLILFVHLFLQVANGASSYGLFFNTVRASTNRFKIKNQILQYLIGSTVFSPSGALGIKITYDTVEESRHLTTNIVQCKKAKGNKKSWPFTIAKLLLISGGYYLAYESSGTLLALNAEFGFTALWGIILTCISLMIFNGFGLMKMANDTVEMAEDFCLFDSAQRNILDKGTKIKDYIENLPSDVVVTADVEGGRNSVSLN